MNNYTLGSSLLYRKRPLEKPKKTRKNKKKQKYDSMIMVIFYDSIWLFEVFFGFFLFF